MILVSIYMLFSPKNPLALSKLLKILKKILKIVIFSFNSNPFGGALLSPHRPISWPFCRTNFFDRVTCWVFTFTSYTSFKTIFGKIRHTVMTLHNFLCKHVSPQTAQKCDFVYKVNANCVFSQTSYKLHICHCFSLLLTEINWFYAVYDCKSVPNQFH